MGLWDDAEIHLHLLVYQLITGLYYCSDESYHLITAQYHLALIFSSSPWEKRNISISDFCCGKEMFCHS